MAASQAKKKTTAKKRPAKGRKTTRKKSSVFSLKRVFAAVILMGMLVFSIGVVGYVIFFRTVLA